MAHPEAFLAPAATALPYRVQFGKNLSFFNVFLHLQLIFEFALKAAI